MTIEKLNTTSVIRGLNALVLTILTGICGWELNTILENTKDIAILKNTTVTRDDHAALSAKAVEGDLSLTKALGAIAETVKFIQTRQDYALQSIGDTKQDIKDMKAVLDSNRETLLSIAGKQDTSNGKH